MKKHNGITNNILDLVGNTPLVRLNRITNELDGQFLAKYEAFNPGHSMKDRIATHIVEQAERKGILKKGSKVIETTSGNTGFSVALVCIIKGYECILAVNSKASKGKINMLRAMGAKVYVCPANVSADDPRSYYQVAKRLHEETADSVYINQYFNELNSEAHYLSTGPEIWEQTDGKLTHVVVASGTGGTISGVGKYLKEKNPNIKVLGVDAYGSILKKFHETSDFDTDEIYPYRIEGLGKNLIPTATNFEVIDVFEKVTDEDAAHKARQLALEEGLFTGYTSGAVVQATLQYADQGYFDKDSMVVMILPDHGSRYMEKVYSDDWMREQGFFDAKKHETNTLEIIR
ncbi:PLP-dependent cysteine synthase family protein [Lutimonas zeaxanthinifaciens]|uniref:PLP-dependent cysteine synthase family protein n=1 Tax=Lutimonas zeaxanthinifaciens TaxID=3060215 RepID=UPI00265D1749|nr:cysteine synthase family protein [Lutimonas sp. YSD2104]WKK65001.1 cysteine synthase family protein [Lutimonas sp. YSD2104]